MMILMESMNQWGISWEYPWGFERKKMGMSVISHFLFETEMGIQY